MIFDDGRTQAAGFGVGGDKFERLVDARAGLEQQREIAGEEGDVLKARAGGEFERPARGLAGAVVADGFDRDEAEIFDAQRDFRRARRP